MTDFNNQITQRLYDLLNRALDNSIEETGKDELESLLLTYPQARRIYIESMIIDAGFYRMGGVPIQLEHDQVYPDIVHSVPLYETVTKDLDESVIRQTLMCADNNGETSLTIPEKPLPRRFGRNDILHTLPKIAAILLICLSVLAFDRMVTRYAQPPARPKVAALIDQYQSTWDPAGPDLANGDRLGGDHYYLLQGYAELLYDNGTRVLLEGPAAFSCTSPENLLLNHGNVYVQVSKQGLGFTVDAPDFRVCDLGTEFGVSIGKDNSHRIQLHQGKASLISMVEQKERQSVVLNDTQAFHVNSQSGQIVETDFDRKAFVRRIESSKGLIWRGEDLSLADIVAGGDGLGTGKIAEGINPADGSLEFVCRGENLSIEPAYHLVANLPYVDGVFVPDGGEGNVTISSLGHLFSDCPDTSGEMFDSIRNGGQILQGDLSTLPMMLDYQLVGTESNPALYFHPNLGITFDLDAIRAVWSGWNLESFQTLCGISSNSPQYSTADIFILIDGDLRFEKLNLSSRSEIPLINVPITDEDRFLTLISTEADNLITCDWVLFVNPVLKLTTE